MFGEIKIHRRSGTQDISWFLDQHRLKRLDLDPPYQRRSVWTAADRRYFLDTIFRGFPCPPIYLHKTIDNSGSAMFHVVDGKQRIETIIRFAAENKLRIPPEFGDERLNNKRWKDITSDTDVRNAFLNYAFVVEYFDEFQSTTVNEIFERMNKNSRKLTQQELRNARFDGWFSKEIESEVDEAIWKTVKIVTPARARRMADAQFIAELFMIIIHNAISGFDHSKIDQVFADLEDIENPDISFDKDYFKEKLSKTRQLLSNMVDLEPEIIDYCSSVSNLYTIWATLVIDADQLPGAPELSKKYIEFMNSVSSIAERKRPSQADQPNAPAVAEEPTPAFRYYDANQSATTEYPQRLIRLQALREAFGINIGSEIVES